MRKTWFTRVALVAVAAMFASLQVFAQGGGGGGGQRQMPTPEERAKQLKERLTLTDEQTAKITVIYQAQQKDFTAAREKAGDDRDAMRAALTEIRAKYDKQIQAILTDKQKEEYAKYQEEQRQKMQQRMGGGGGGQQ